MRRLIILFPVALLLGACSMSQPRPADRCPLPPKSFSATDLVGTWVAGWSDDLDTLIIRADNTYKQLIHLRAPTFDYESDWQPWRIDYSVEGRPYLHLEGMRLCAYGGGEIAACNQIGGGTGNSGYWYDPCRDTWLQMPGEGVLIVVGPTPGFQPPARGIHLFLLMKGEDGWDYQLQQR
jgi:hypothetical protein